MYRVNPLLRNTLITTDEVIFHAPTKQTIDPRMIEQNIIIAEERFIRPLLGLAMYNDMCSQKNEVVDNTTLDELTEDVNADLPDGAPPYVLNIGDIVNAMEFLEADYLNLWKTYLWKLTAECVMLMSMAEGFVQFGNEGVSHSMPQSGALSAAGVVSPALKTVQWAIDKKMMDRVDPLIEATKLFLAGNNGSYPLYVVPPGCGPDGISTLRKSDIVLGLYDDIDNCNTGYFSTTGPSYDGKIPNSNNCGSC